MKKFYNKCLISVLCVLALIVACGSGFAVPAGAWGSEDIGDDALVYERNLPLTVYTEITGNSFAGDSRYEGGQWPNVFPVSFDGATDTFRLWRMSDLPFEKGHGLLTVVNFSGLSTIGLENIDNVRLVMLGDSPLLNNSFYVYADGSTKITTGTSNLFGTDCVLQVVEMNSWFSFYVTGTLLGDVGRAYLEVNLKDGFTFTGNINFNGLGATFVSSSQEVVPPTVDSVTLSASSPAPYFPGTYVQMQVDVTGTGSFDSSVTWSVDSGLSGGVTIDENGLLYIPTDEQALSVEVTATSVADPNISGSYTVDITYPLQGVSIVPSGKDFYPFSSKDRTIQYSLLLPNGDPYDYELLAWIIDPTAGAEDYYSVDDAGLVTIKGGAPVGSGYTLKWAYAWDTDNPAPDSVSFSVISNNESIQEELDDYINGDHGFDSSGSDFSGAAGDLQNSSNQMNNAMSGGMNHLGAMMNSVDFTTTLTTLGSGLDALFEGHEVTICGVTANPFELDVTILAIAILLPLALKFIFRKWGSGSSGGGTDA